MIEYVHSRRQHKCEGEHNTWPVGETYQYKYLAPTQKRLPNALVEGVGVGGGGFGQFRQIYLFVVLIFYNDISQHM